MNKFGIIAIHGNTEPGTSDIAKQLAGEYFPLYIDDKEGHIASHLYFNEEFELFTNSVGHIVSIHGFKDTSSSITLVGGLAKDIISKITESLEKNGFTIKDPPENLDGDDTNNVCNRGRLKKGIQLELSKALRDELAHDDKRMKLFCGTIRGCLN